MIRQILLGTVAAIPVPVLLIYFNYLSQQKLHYGSML